MSLGLNGCSIRFVPRQSIKIAQLTPAPTTFSMYNLYSWIFFIDLVQVLHTQAVQNTEFCNKNI